MNKQENQPKVTDLTSSLTDEAVLIPRNVLDELITNLNLLDFETIKHKIIEQIKCSTNIEDYIKTITTEVEFRNVIDKYKSISEEEYNNRQIRI